MTHGRGFFVACSACRAAAVRDRSRVRRHNLAQGSLQALRHERAVSRHMEKDCFTADDVLRADPSSSPGG